MTQREFRELCCYHTDTSRHFISSKNYWTHLNISGSAQNQVSFVQQEEAKAFYTFVQFTRKRLKSLGSVWKTRDMPDMYPKTGSLWAQLHWTACHISRQHSQWQLPLWQESWPPGWVCDRYSYRSLFAKGLRVTTFRKIRIWAIFIP